MKNKTIAIIGTAVLIGALLTGCNKNTVVTETNNIQEPSEVYSAVITDDSGREDSEPEESEPVSKGMMTGGWAACADNNSKSGTSSHRNSGGFRNQQSISGIWRSKRRG